MREPLYSSITVLFQDILPEKIFNFLKAVNIFGGEKKIEITFGYLCFFTHLFLEKCFLNCAYTSFNMYALLKINI